jgi:hypothetical protein
VQVEWREIDIDVVFLLQSFDLNEADVAPGSDEVRSDDYRSAFGDYGKLLVVDVCHAVDCTVPRANRPRVKPDQAREKEAQIG